MPLFNTMTRRPAACLLAFAAAAALGLPARAADHLWLDGSGNHLWYSSGGVVGGVFQPNWSAAGVPSFGSPGRVFIDNNPARNSLVQIAPLSLVNTPFCTNPVSCGTFAVAAGMTIDAGDTAVVGGAAPFGDSAQHFSNGHIALQMMDIAGAGSTLTNNGLLRISSDGKYAKLAIQGVVTLTGSGQTVLDNGYASSDSRATFNSNQVVFGANGFGDRLVIAAGHTVRGRGSLGYNGTLAIDNHGTVQAEAGGVLSLNGPFGLVAPRTHGIVNTGTLRAVDAARLWITSTVDNTGGLIEAVGDGAVVDLGGGITNGTLRSLGNGVLRANGSGISFTTVGGEVLLQQGRLLVADGTKLGLGPRFTNQGVLQLGGPSAPGVGFPGGSSELHFTQDTLIDGTGRIELSDRAGANLFTGYAGVIGRTPVLTLGAGQVLTGAGILGGASTGSRSLNLVNQGTVLAAAANPLVLAAATGNTGFTNQGLLQVQTTLQVVGGFTNQGTVVVDADATLSGTALQAAGTFTVDGSAGTVRLSGGLLNGTGSIAQVLQTGGTFAPGHSPGTLTLGSLTLSGGDLVLEIDGEDPAQQDHLVVTGDANLYGGRLLIDLSGYHGSAAASFNSLLSVGGVLRLDHPSLHTTTHIVVTGLAPGWQSSLQWNGGQLGLSVSAVPEPATAASLLAGLMVLAGRRRATRRQAPGPGHHGRKPT